MPRITRIERIIYARSKRLSVFIRVIRVLSNLVNLDQIATRIM